MAFITYPSTLPAPSANSMVPLERRLLSALTAGKPDARTLDRDFIGYETLQWDLMIDESAIWHDWWQNTLIEGGRWFSSTWLRFNGDAVVIARFTAPPVWKYTGNDRWQISVGTEIHGKLGVTAPPHVEPGGGRLYDLLWTLAGRRLDNTPFYITGEAFTAPSGVSWGPINESQSDLTLSLYSHNLGTLVPAGALLVFTATTTRTDSSTYGTVPAVQTQSSTTLRTFDIVVDASPYGRFYAPMLTVVTTTVDGAPAPFTASFVTNPRAGYGTPGSRYDVIDITTTSAYTA